MRLEALPAKERVAVLAALAVDELAHAEAVRAPEEFHRDDLHRSHAVAAIVGTFNASETGSSMASLTISTSVHTNGAANIGTHTASSAISAAGLSLAMGELHCGEYAMGGVA